MKKQGTIHPKKILILCLPKETLGSAPINRVGRVTVNTTFMPEKCFSFFSN